MSRTYLKSDDPTRPYRRALGKRIRDRMTHLELTQERLGDMVGVTKMSVSDWLNPAILAMPGLNLVERLAFVLRCDVTWLVTGKGRVP